MWNAIYKKLWIVVLVPLLAAGIAFLLTYKKAGQYRSVAVVEASIPDQPTKTQTLKDIQEPDQYYQNMVNLMKTEVITSMVSYRLLLHDLEKEIAFRPPAIQYSESKKAQIRKTLEKKLASFALLSENIPAEATIGQIIHNMDYDIARWVRDGEMTIVRKPETNEIEVSTSTEDPFLSAFASNALSQEYIRYESSIIAPPPVKNDSIGYYRQEVDRLRKEVEVKTEALNEAAARKNSPVDDLRFRRAKSNRIAEYEMKIVEEEWQLNSLREELSKLQREGAEEEPQQTIDVASNAKIQAARKKIDQLSALYVQGGSNDKQLDSIINVLRKQVNDETVRLQMASQNSTAESPRKREQDILQGRIERHEQNIASIRSDIRRLKNASPSTQDNQVEIAPLRTAQEEANKQYTLALNRLRALEVKAGITTTNGRASHHLILKEKALPSAEPESPWAMLIVISSFVGTLVICLIVIAVTRPAPTIHDDIFLRVNYANRQRRLSNQQPVTDNQ